MSSYTIATAESFTITHAKRLASKVATDLKRFQRLYGMPSDEQIAQYEAELTVLLRYDALSEITYGFSRNGTWVEAVKYRGMPGGNLQVDDDPGKIRSDADITGATFHSFLISAKDLTPAQEAELPFKRGSGNEPQPESGWWQTDLTYTAGGYSLGRKRIIR